jgi:hypothetical protein
MPGKQICPDIFRDCGSLAFGSSGIASRKHTRKSQKQHRQQQFFQQFLTP